MNNIQKHLAEHRIATYCIVTFALTWGLRRLHSYLWRRFSTARPVSERNGAGAATYSPIC